jgi:hypothetical protein
MVQKSPPATYRRQYAALLNRCCRIASLFFVRARRQPDVPEVVDAEKKCKALLRRPLGSAPLPAATPRHRSSRAFRTAWTCSAGEQRLAQQLNTLRDTLRRAVVQQAEALREEVQRAAAQQAETLATTRVASARRREVPAWLLLALLGLTCAGVLLLVLVRVLGW